MNDCGDCTLCCELFPVEWLSKPPDVRCAHDVGGGCDIHETKPAECSDFDCSFLQSSAPPGLRPDRCGIVFEKLSERLFHGTVSHFTEAGKGQVHAFLGQGFSVSLGGPHRGPALFLAEGHDEDEIRAELMQRTQDQWRHTQPT